MTADAGENRFIKIDEEGYFQMGELRVTDAEFARSLFDNLRFTEHDALITRTGGKEVWVEAFDEPLIVLQIHKTAPRRWRLLMPYGFERHLSLESDNGVLTSLFLDEWDRFHGLTEDGLPFVLSRSAQAGFFDQLEDFDDTGLYVDGERLEIPDWLTETPEIADEKFWSDIYRNEQPRWELEREAPALKDILPQLKLPRANAAVLGCGSGNDAAFLARNGHIVTGIDISPEAIARAKSKYGTVRDLQFEQYDVFDLPEKLHGQFDLVFEHTCFCAVSPRRRDDLIGIWKKLLVPGGRVLGIFFVHPKRHGPPFGGSEWELRKRFTQAGFRPLYWTRWHHSLPQRMGKELVVFAEKPEKN